MTDMHGGAIGTATTRLTKLGMKTHGTRRNMIVPTTTAVLADGKKLGMKLAMMKNMEEPSEQAEENCC